MSGVRKKRTINTIYKYNFVGMAINIDNLRDFQRTWQNWSINEEGFPNNLIPLIFPKKIEKKIIPYFATILLNFKPLWVEFLLQTDHLIIKVFQKRKSQEFMKKIFMICNNFPEYLFLS